MCRGYQVAAFFVFIISAIMLVSIQVHTLLRRFATECISSAISYFHLNFFLPGNLTILEDFFLPQAIVLLPLQNAFIRIVDVVQHRCYTSIFWIVPTWVHEPRTEANIPHLYLYIAAYFSRWLLLLKVRDLFIIVSGSQRAKGRCSLVEVRMAWVEVVNWCAAVYEVACGGGDAREEVICTSLQPATRRWSVEWRVAGSHPTRSLSLCDRLPVLSYQVLTWIILSEFQWLI